MGGVGGEREWAASGLKAKKGWPVRSGDTPAVPSVVIPDLFLRGVVPHFDGARRADVVTAGAREPARWQVDTWVALANGR